MSILGNIGSTMGGFADSSVTGGTIVTPEIPVVQSEGKGGILGGLSNTLAGFASEEDAQIAANTTSVDFMTEEETIAELAMQMRISNVNGLAAVASNEALQNIIKREMYKRRSKKDSEYIEYLKTSEEVHEAQEAVNELKKLIAKAGREIKAAMIAKNNEERKNLTIVRKQLKEELVKSLTQLIEVRSYNAFARASLKATVAYNRAVLSNKNKYGRTLYARHYTLDQDVKKSALKQTSFELENDGYSKIPWSSLVEGFSIDLQGTVSSVDTNTNGDKFVINLGVKKNVYGEYVVHGTTNDLVVVDVDANFNGNIAERVVVETPAGEIKVCKNINEARAAYGNVEQFFCIPFTNGTDKKNVMLYVRDNMLDQYNVNMDKMVSVLQIGEAYKLIGKKLELKDMEALTKRIMSANNQLTDKITVGNSDKAVAVIQGKLSHIVADFLEQEREELKELGYDENMETPDGAIIFAEGEFKYNNQQIRGDKLQIKGLSQAVPKSWIPRILNFAKETLGINFTILGSDNINDVAMIVDLNAVKHKGIAEVSKAVKNGTLAQDIAEDFIKANFENFEMGTLKASKGSVGARSSNQAMAKLKVEEAQNFIKDRLCQEYDLETSLNSGNNSFINKFGKAMGEDAKSDEVVFDEHRSEMLSRFESVVSKDKFNMERGFYAFITFDLSGIIFNTLGKGLLGYTKTRFNNEDTMMPEAFSMEFIMDNAEEIAAIENDATLTDAEKVAKLDELCCSVGIKYPSQSDEEFQMFRFLTMKELVTKIETSPLSGPDKQELTRYYTELNTKVTFLPAVNYLKCKLAGLDVDGDTMMFMGGLKFLELFAAKANKINSVTVITTRSDEDRDNSGLRAMSESEVTVANRWSGIGNVSLETIVQNGEAMSTLKNIGDKLDVDKVMESRYRYVMIFAANKRYAVNQIGQVTLALGLARLDVNFLMVDGKINEKKFCDIFAVDTTLAEENMVDYSEIKIKPVVKYDRFGNETTFFMVDSDAVYAVLDGLRKFNYKTGTIEHLMNLNADLQHIARALQESTIDKDSDSAKVFTYFEAGKEIVITHEMFVNKSAKSAARAMVGGYTEFRTKAQLKSFLSNPNMLKELKELIAQLGDEEAALAKFCNEKANAVVFTPVNKTVAKMQAAEKDVTYVIDDSFEYKKAEAYSLLYAGFKNSLKSSNIMESEDSTGFLYNYKQVSSVITNNLSNDTINFMMELLSFVYDGGLKDMLKSSNDDHDIKKKANELATAIMLSSAKGAFGADVDVKEAVAGVIYAAANFSEGKGKEAKMSTKVKVRQAVKLFEDVAFEVLTDATRNSLTTRGLVDEAAALEGVDATAAIRSFNTLLPVRTVIVKASNKEFARTTMMNTTKDLSLEELKEVEGVGEVLTNFEADGVIELTKAVKVFNGYNGSCAYFFIDQQ